jgi:hypothetical protein
MEPFIKLENVHIQQRKDNAMYIDSQGHLDGKQIISAALQTSAKDFSKYFAVEESKLPHHHECCIYNCEDFPVSLNACGNTIYVYDPDLNEVINDVK